MIDWTADEQREVKRALLGSWPGTITTWGRDAFAAYIGELEARGLTASRVLYAIRTWPAGSDFPPSAPNLAAAARHDPSVPTFEELLELIRFVLAARTSASKSFWADGERARLDLEARELRAREVHPLAGSFTLRYGIERLHRLGLFDAENEWREPRRRELRLAWEQHCEASEGREVAALVAPRSSRGDLGRFDPLAALGVRRPEIGAGR